MITQILAIRDAKANAFMQPFAQQSLGQAERGFSDEINNASDNNVMYRHPEDFQLYHLGSYNDADGSFDLLSTPRLIASGDSVKRAPV